MILPYHLSVIRNRRGYFGILLSMRSRWKIHYVMGAVLFPAQIIVGKELKQTSHAWLKALSDKMQKQEMRELLERIGGLSRKYDKELADSVLEVSIRANKQIIEEMRVCARHY